MTSQKKSKDNLSKEFLAAIGLVAVEWSFLELNLQRAIAKLSKLDSLVGSILTAPSNVSIWTEVLTKLAIHTNHPKAKEIEKLCDTIMKVQTERNKVVHSIWANVFKPDIYPDEKTPWPAKTHNWVFSYIAPKRGKKNIVFDISTTEEIEKVADKISDLCFQLNALIDNKPST